MQIAVVAVAELEAAVSVAYVPAFVVIDTIADIAAFAVVAWYWRIGGAAGVVGVDSPAHSNADFGVAMAFVVLVVETAIQEASLGSEIVDVVGNV